MRNLRHNLNCEGGTLPIGGLIATVGWVGSFSFLFSGLARKLFLHAQTCCYVLTGDAVIGDMNALAYVHLYIQYYVSYLMYVL